MIFPTRTKRLGLLYLIVGINIIGCQKTDDRKVDDLKPQELDLMGVDEPVSWLHVEGRYLKNESNKVAILKGVSIADVEHIDLYREGQTAKGLIERAVTQLGARIIRIPVIPEATDASGFFADPTRYLEDHLDPAIETCVKLNAYVIIDMHLVADYLPKKELAEEFWSIVAPRYNDIPNVMFELFNEPVAPASWETWRNQMAQPLTDLVRKYAPNNIILIGAPLWTSNLSQAVEQPIQGENIVYAGHLYPSIPRENWDIDFLPVIKKFPVIFTEWGYEYGQENFLNATTSTFGIPFVNWLKRHQLGWTAWIFDNQWTSRMLTDDWQLSGGETGMGELVAAALKPPTPSN